MSEIQRYEPGQVFNTATMLHCEMGAWVRYTDLLRYKRQYYMAVSLLVVACAVFSALLVHEKASRGPVQVPIGAAEKMGLLQEMQAAQKERDNWKERAANYKAQIKVLNAKDVAYTSQLEALQARGQELDRINRAQAQRMSTQQGVVLEAKRVLGVNVKVME